MESIIFASTPGIFTNTLLKCFEGYGLTDFIDLHSLRDNTTMSNLLDSSAKRIVFHGEFDAEIIQKIQHTFTATKTILIFDTAELAVLQMITATNKQLSIDACIQHWTQVTGEITLYAENNSGSCVLVDYQSLLHDTSRTLELINNRLNLQLSICMFSPVRYSSIAQLMAASVLIDRDEAMVLYDDAKTLAITTRPEEKYVEARTLINRQQSAAFDELGALLHNLQSDVAVCDLALATKQHRLELDNQVTANSQLREELKAKQVSLNHLKNELTSLSSVRGELSNKQSQMEIALLQINQLQEELEYVFERYHFFEKASDSSLIHKLLGDIPSLGLLKQQIQRSGSAN